MNKLAILSICVYLVGLIPTNCEKPNAPSTQKHVKGGFRYIFQPNTGYNIMYNKNHQTFIIIDYSDEYNVYYGGNTGDVFIIPSDSTTGLYLSHKVSNQTWIAANKSFDDFIKSGIVRPKIFYETGQKTGLQFDSLTISQEIEEKLYAIVSTLSLGYHTGYGSAYGTALEICKSSFINEKLDYSIFDSVDLKISRDVHSVLGLCTGFQDFSKAFGGFDGLKEKNVSFSIEKIMQDQTGLDIIAFFFEQLYNKVDLAELTKRFFETESACLDLLSKLNGDTYIGYGGFVKAVSVIVKYISEEISEQTLIVILEKYFTTPDYEDVDLQKLWDSSSDKAGKMLKRYNLECKFPRLYEMAQEIKNKNWVLKGVNMTKITDIIIKYKTSKNKGKTPKEIVREVKNICKKH